MKNKEEGERVGIKLGSKSDFLKVAKFYDWKHWDNYSSWKSLADLDDRSFCMMVFNASSIIFYTGNGGYMVIDKMDRVKKVITFSEWATKVGITSHMSSFSDLLKEGRKK